MISGISKKFIFSSFLLINFLQPVESAEFSKINKNIHKRNEQLTWYKILNEENLSSFSTNSDYGTSRKKFLKENLNSVLVAKPEKQEQLTIQSDKQYEINDVIYAEGNVSVSYRGNLLKADNLIYDKLNKKINLEDFPGLFCLGFLLGHLLKIRKEIFQQRRKR